MRAGDFDRRHHIGPWKPRLDQVPHLTIETNMTCNFGCRNCYNHNRTHVKTLEEIKKEVDLGLSLRKADTITLIGGEPTLHPELPDIVKYIKSSSGVTTQMLTNGYVFLKGSEEGLLERLKANGLDRVILHIDDGQQEYDDPCAYIHRFLHMARRLDLLTTVSWTVYRSRKAVLPGLVREFSAYSCFDGLLCVLEKSIDDAVRPEYDSTGWPKLMDEYCGLSDSLGLQPSLYLPSSNDDKAITWLLYLYYINSFTGETFHLSSRLTRLYQRLYRAIKKRELFGAPPMRNLSRPVLFVAGFFECILSPSRVTGFLRLLRRSGRTRHIRYQYIALQDGPVYNPATGMAGICYHCPDATVRNGMILPVCLADRISPLPGASPLSPLPPAFSEHVARHLNPV